MPTDTEVMRVAVETPPVWRDNIELWFSNIESQFEIATITADGTKFHHVVSALDSELSSFVSDIIKNPPAEDSYVALKKRLIDQFSDSESARIRILLSDMSLGDLRQSQLLHKMTHLSATKVSDEVLKMLWLQRLPLNIQQILSVSSDKLESLATIADKISEIAIITPTISAMQDDSDRISRLEATAAELNKTIKRLSSFRSKSPRSRLRSKSPARKQYSTCWYHFKFGNKALKCKQPCNFQEN
ncbi:uncharacterized protein [Parasteatoda tepidariorum]|uniref:uncharacterized protein n=1 Tax=Parasteatoda tepidariorum TaxID=114398 RepID=UPI0039BC8EFC